MESNSDDVRMLQEETLAGIRRICDPTLGAVIPSDLGAETSPTTCQSLTAWGQFDAVPPGVNGVSIPQALVWFPKQFPTALLRMSLQQSSIPQGFSIAAGDSEFLSFNLQTLKIIRPFFCPVENNRDIKYSPDLPRFYSYGRLIGGHVEVKSDATSTTSVALAGTIDCGILSDFTFAPDFDPATLAQYTVSKKDALLSVGIQEGVAMINGPTISNRFRGINGAKQLDEGNTTYTSLFDCSTDSNTAPFFIDLPNMTSTGSLLPNAPVPGAVAWLVSSQNAPLNLYSPQSPPGTMTSKGLWISPWFSSSNTNVTNLPCPPVSPYDEPIIRVQINLSQAGSTDGLPKMQNCMLAQVTMTDVWCYEFQNPDGSRTLQYVSSPGGVDVYPLSTYTTALDTTPPFNLTQTNFAQGTNFVFPNITKTAAAAPGLPGTTASTVFLSQTEFVHRAVRPGYASNTNSYARGVGLSYAADPNQANLMYAGTYISAVGVIAASGAGAPPTPVKVQVLRVDFGVPNAEQELNSCLITQWRKVALGQSIVCNFKGFVQADPGRDLAPFQNSVRGNTEAIRMLTPHSMEFLRLLFNSQNVLSFRRIFKLGDYELHKANVQNLSWGELYNIVSSVADLAMRQQLRLKLSAHDTALAWSPFSWLRDVGRDVEDAASWVGKNVVRPTAGFVNRVYNSPEGRSLGKDLVSVGRIVSNVAPKIAKGIIKAAPAIESLAPVIGAFADGEYDFDDTDELHDTEAEADAWFALLDKPAAEEYGPEASNMRPKAFPAFGFIFRRSALRSALARMQKLLDNTQAKNPETIKRAIAYVEKCINKNSGAYHGYTIKLKNPTRQGNDEIEYVFLPDGFSLRAAEDGKNFVYRSGFQDYVKEMMIYQLKKSSANRIIGKKATDPDFQRDLEKRIHARMLLQARMIIDGLNEFGGVRSLNLVASNFVPTLDQVRAIRRDYPGHPPGVRSAVKVGLEERPYLGEHVRRSMFNNAARMRALLGAEGASADRPKIVRARSPEAVNPEEEFEPEAYVSSSARSVYPRGEAGLMTSGKHSGYGTLD